MSVHISTIADLPVPVKIIVEARSSSRVALGKKEIIIRLPKHISVVDKEKTLQQFLRWARQQIHQKSYYQAQLQHISHYHERTLKILEESFQIEIAYHEAGRNKLSYRGDNTLRIYLRESMPEQDMVAEVQRFLLRFTERYFLPKIQQRTLAWNEHHFQEKIEKIELKHTTSRWGSCSSTRRLTFSTKLLLLPEHIIDYVIVHELAHLRQMNHSPRFWKEVEQAMPDYKIRREWLKKHGHTIDF